MPDRAARYCSYLTTLITAHPVQICLTRVWQCGILLCLNVCLFSCVRCVAYICGIAELTSFSLEIAKTLMLY